MPLASQYVQAPRMRRCVITAGAGALLRDLIVAAFNAQKAKRGDVLKPYIVGVRFLVATVDFTVSNPDATGGVTIPWASLPYDPSCAGAGYDTWISGSSTIGIEVYLSDIPEGY